MDKQAKQLEREFTKLDEMTRLAIAFTALADNSNALRLLDRYLAGIRRDYDRAFQRLLDLRILNSPDQPHGLSEPRGSATGLSRTASVSDRRKECVITERTVITYLTDCSK